ncbi:hypothetical protein D3C80_2222290 [compost metagenome]
MARQLFQLPLQLLGTGAIRSLQAHSHLLGQQQSLQPSPPARHRQLLCMFQ